MAEGSQITANVIAVQVRRQEGDARRRHIGSAAAGTVYDIVQEDKRKAIEIVVAGKAESRDFERGEDDKD